MNHLYPHTAILALGCILSAAPLSAQTPSKEDEDAPASLSLLKAREATLASGNAAWLHTLSSDESLSEAKLWSGWDEGGLHDYEGSNHLWEWGAQTESFLRLSPKAVVYGKVAYRNERGKDMGGSAWIDPYEMPFDFVELSDDNRGNKQLETYLLQGALSYALGKRLNLGAAIDYTAANYVKQKDLRHVNKLMDMTLRLGATYQVSKTWTMGADYHYSRRTEGILFSMYGTTDRVYNTLVDYGGFYGKNEQFGDNGYTSKSEEKPLFDEYHSANIQLRWQPNAAWQIFAEGAYSHRSGYYGKESPSTVVYSKHHGDNLKGTLSLRYQPRPGTGQNAHHTMHLLRLAFQQDQVNNEENIYRYVNQGGGLNTVEYYGTLEVGDKTHRTASAHYLGQWGWKQGHPNWQITTDFTYQQRQSTASAYPFYRKVDLHRYQAIAEGKRWWGRWSAAIRSGFSVGGGSMADDGVYATPSGSQQAPTSMPLYQQQAYEYFTAKQWQGGISLSYEHRLTAPKLRAFAELAYDYRQASSVSSLDNDHRHCIELSVGCRF